MERDFHIYILLCERKRILASSNRRSKLSGKVEEAITLLRRSMTSREISERVP